MVVEQLKKPFKRPEFRLACLPSGSYNSNSVLAISLEQIALSHPNSFVRDVALWSRIVLGVAGESRGTLLTEIHSRMPEGGTGPHRSPQGDCRPDKPLSSLHLLADTREVKHPTLQGEQQLLAHCLTGSGPDPEGSPTDRELQDEVWERIWHLGFANELLDSRFHLGNELAHLVIPRAVVRSILSLLKPGQSDILRIRV